MRRAAVNFKGRAFDDHFQPRKVLVIAKASIGVRQGPAIEGAGGGTPNSPAVPARLVPSFACPGLGPRWTAPEA